MTDEPAKRDRMLLRSALAGLLIVLLTAGATATAALLEIDRWVPPEDTDFIPEDEQDDLLPDTKPGKPQTLLLLGSDRRWIDKQNGDPARSDTMMLVRLDPDESATTVLSIPRDLKVAIPGHGYAKVNDAYALGGPALTVRTIKQLTGLDIHHVVNVNFGGFREAVDALGCFYIDVDRRYYHSNEGVPIGQRYAEIDVPAGYQRLCGQDALDYVRFRHADSDLVRAARQQDFLRSAKDQISTSSLIRDRKRLARIFGEHTQTDKDLSTLGGFIRLLKLALYSAKRPVRQIEFPATFTKGFAADGLAIDYVEASAADIQAAVDQFMDGGGEQAEPRAASGGKRRKRPTTLAGLVAAGQMVDGRAAAETLVRNAKGRRRLGIPLRFPAYLTAAGRYAEQQNPRVYTLRDRADREHTAYRFTVVESVVEGAYYGVQGTTWRTPPLLAHPSAVRRVNGRRLELFRSGRKLRFVAWRTRAGAYWVSNTLTMKLRDDQMLALAASLTTARKAKRRGT
ncbi:MAG TPA: LCP family protein [Solirubrobacteraceae bacterium]|nr:LCP family protein [Solirubrobacteraceae bacterium]